MALDFITRVDPGGIFIDVTRPAYGAVSGGIVDVAASVELAIDAVNALGGGTVYFPPGEYLIDTATTALNGTTGVNLVGDGATITTTLNANIFNIDSVTRFRATGLRFVGNFAGTYNNQHAFNSNPGGTDIEIDHCFFESLSGGIFHADGGSKIRIHHNDFLKVGAPIQFGTGAIKSRIDISFNKITGSATFDIDDAIAMSGANEDLLISYNDINQMGSVASTFLHARGVLLESSSSGLACQRAIVSHNIIRNSYGVNALQANTAAIAVTTGGGASHWSDVQIIHNEIEKAYRGIRIDNFASGLIIKTNIIRTATADGIFINVTGNDAHIEGNEIYSPGTKGIDITNPDRPSILNNLIDGAGDTGIWMDASASPIITGNRVRNSTNDGMLISNTLNAIIDANNFSDNGRYGLNLSGTSVNTPLGIANRFTGNATAPINGGACISNILLANAFLDFGSTAAQSHTDLTMTVTGAADGDVVSLGVPNGVVLADSSFSAWVSAANTVTIRFLNASATSKDPGAGTYRVAVTQIQF